MFIARKKLAGIFYLFLSILHYFTEFSTKIGGNYDMKHRLAYYLGS